MERICKTCGQPEHPHNFRHPFVPGKQVGATEQQHFDKIDSVISLFENGKEKYQTSAIFNKVITMLAMGENPYAIIDDLVQHVENTKKILEEYAAKNQIPTMIAPNQE